MHKILLRDLGASIVVFLVALPLCLGVAIASGAPPALGILSGIVGGLVVGSLAGSPLQVSGPAAGLVVSVWAIIEGWGLRALGLAVIICGVLQIAAAMMKLGGWFRAVSPALIGGMLAGIGVLISLSQLHVMVGASPPGGGFADLLGLPASWSGALATPAGYWSAIVGGGTLAILIGWDRFRPEQLSGVPAPLLGVLIATIGTAVMSLPVANVQLPPSLHDALNMPTLESLELLKDSGFWGASLALGLIAAAESLLCANATDQLHDGPRTHYDRELFALGVGNLTCGVIGALPVTGVIVRSAANIQAGAKSRAASMIQGAMLLIAVAFVPWILGYIPVPALAGVLVYVGSKLFAPEKAKKLYDEGQGEVWVYLITVAAIVIWGLLNGILIGLAASLLKLLYAFSHLEVAVAKDPDSERWDIDIHGAATFVQLPRLAQALDQVPEHAEVHVHLGGLAYVDHACAELLHRHQERRERAGGVMITEWDEVSRLREEKPLLTKLKEARPSILPPTEGELGDVDIPPPPKQPEV